MTGYQSKRAAAQDKMVRMTHIEALKLALKVLEDLPGFRADIDNAITAIKEALAQPAQCTWVDLPHEDILDLFDEHNVYGSKWLEFARAVLAKSKEKNT
jgi:hypothetical protein